VETILKCVVGAGYGVRNPAFSPDKLGLAERSLFKSQISRVTYGRLEAEHKSLGFSDLNRHTRIHTGTKKKVQSTV